MSSTEHAVCKWDQHNFVMPVTEIVGAGQVRVIGYLCTKCGQVVEATLPAAHEVGTTV